MIRARTFSAFLALVVGSVVSPFARGELTLTDYVWTGNVNSDWQTNGNWDVADFPNDGLHSASITSTADLTLNLGATDVEVAELLLNATGGSTDINITGTGRLIFQNDDNNVGFDPDPLKNDVEDILTYEGVNNGRVNVVVNGAVGSTHTISAPIRLTNNGFLEGVDFSGNRSITLSGPIDIVGAVAEDVGQIRSYLPTGTKLLITGPINLTDAGDNTTARVLSLNDYHTSDHNTPPHGTIEITGQISGLGAVVAGWNWDVNLDDVVLGDPADPPGVPLGTVILSGNNTFTGDVVMSRGNLVIRHDNALGDATSVDSVVTQAGKTGADSGLDGVKREVGFNLVVDAGDRTIARTMAIQENVTFKGSSSLTWTGMVYQDASRTLINIIDTGETVTFDGPVYPNRKGEGDFISRILPIDGTGKTVFRGGIHDQYVVGGETGDDRVGHLLVRGTGSVVIDFDDSNAPDTATDYTGYTFIDGANLHFNDSDDLPSGTFMTTAGAVSVDTDVTGNSDLLNKLNNSTNPNQGYLATPFFVNFDNNTPIFAKFSEGGLMLAKVTESLDEYSEDLNFDGTQVANPLARAANMTLAAHEGGNTYTGTITPSTSISYNPNTYQLGGGTGKLTLPDAQLSGSRSLLVTNGGEVRLEGANTYSGTGTSVDGVPVPATRIIGKLRESLQEIAETDTGDPDLDRYYGETSNQILLETTLTVTNLADGSSASSVGSSTSAANNLFIQRATLKYEGGAVATDRLFTVGTAGATIDASGTGALNFENTGALAIDIAEDRYAIVHNGVYGSGNNEIFGNPLAGNHAPFETDDLTPGIQVHAHDASSGTLQTFFEDDDSPVVITEIPTSHVVLTGEVDLLPSELDGDEGTTPNRWGGVGSANFRYQIKFGPAPTRFLTLSAGNTAGGLGDNTLAPLVTDASDRDEAGYGGGPGGLGSVGIRKTGVGKWILTGNNTYTGEMQVQEGTLLVNGTQTGTGLTTVSAGATLGGSGTLGGAVTNNGTLAPGASIESLATGSVTFGLDSIFEVELSGATKDQLLVTGDIDLTALGNTLDVIELAAPTLTSYVIATYSGTLMGEFESITEGWEVHYGDGSNDVITLNLVDDLLIGDYNGDGKVSAADFTVWRDSLGALTLTNRDPDNLGAVGNADFESWKEHYGEGTFGSGAGSGIAASSVPEPTSFTLLALGGLIGLAVTRRRK